MLISMSNGEKPSKTAHEIGRFLQIGAHAQFAEHETAIACSWYYRYQVYPEK
jgi:hypothetical protein